MPLSVGLSQDNISFDTSDTEGWTSSTPSSVEFDTPRTSLTAEFTNSFEDLRDMSSSPISNSSISHPLIPAGTYGILNAVDPDCSLDLSGYDNESIIAYGANGGGNQMWEIRPLGPGYSIKAISPAKYVTLKDGISAGGQMRGSAYPVSWTIEKAEQNTPFHRIKWPESDFLIDAPEGGKGHIVQLLNAPVGTDPPSTTQWLLVPQFDDQPSTVLKKLDTFEVKSEPNVTKSVSNTVVDTEGLKEGGSGNVSITTTTTTTSTSVTTISGIRGFNDRLCTHSQYFP